MSLVSLPTELQCQVIRLLDPISLISISQANTHFRHLIKPKKRHFAERLLVLELNPDHGGPTPIFYSRTGHLKPDWHDEAWDAIKWACTDCLRLLPHKYFDNHSILRLGYRKPIPGSFASRMITTWEPTWHTRPRDKNRERAKRNAQDAQREEKKRRQGYFLAVTGGLGYLRNNFVNNFEAFRECGIDGFQGMSVDQLRDMDQGERLKFMDQHALAIEREDCGKKRWLRKCNECRFQRGAIWQACDPTCGTRQVPIVPSQRVEFASVVERYFPRFWESLDHKKPLYNIPRGLIYKEDACEQLWSMWMVRCPTCEHWQELRAFRIGGLYQHWYPERRAMDWNSDRRGRGEDGRTWDDKTITEQMLNEACCNSCFAESNGRQELGQALCEWLFDLIKWEMRHIGYRLTWDFNFLKWKTRDNPSKKYSVEWKRLLRQTPCLDQNYRYIFTHSDIALLRHCREQWKLIWEDYKRNVGDGQIDEDLDTRTKAWTANFESLEAHWSWLNGCMMEIEEKPEALVEWALSRDGALFT
ncbi:hypothetical protein NW762_006354 [Fusarium torreyae]|uniref:F-box domain-containing protein n=1 Tax=Fusarium torreyae TaxID=1237075 RepID=A0A9W8S3B3_9HYPO|nr:hypothetical protein NW762_006354 [Fusarium torreyae]